MPAFWASAWKNSRTSSVSNVPIFGALKATFQTRKGRPETIDGGFRHRLVHGEVDRGVAGDATAVAERLGRWPGRSQCRCLRRRGDRRHADRPWSRSPCRSANDATAGRAYGRRSRRRSKSSTAPVPSRLTETDTEVSLVLRDTDPVRLAAVSAIWLSLRKYAGSLSGVPGNIQKRGCRKRCQLQSALANLHRAQQGRCTTRGNGPPGGQRYMR
jgi:hypothetical protein